MVKKFNNNESIKFNLKELKMKKLVLGLSLILIVLISGNAFAHVKTLYSDKGITTYCVDGLKFAVAGGESIIQVMENVDNHAVPKSCSMK
jgi:hypothetical protein